MSPWHVEWMAREIMARAQAMPGWDVQYVQQARDLHPSGDAHPDGILCCAGGAGVKAFATHFAAGVPIVNVCDEPLPGVPVSYCMFDNAAIGDLAAAYLLRKRPAAFVYAGDPSRCAFARIRRDAFRACLLQAGVPATRLHDWVQTTNPQLLRSKCYTDPACLLVRWLAALPRPAALFCANDYLARELLEAAAAAGMRVPWDLSVVGVDDEQWPRPDGRVSSIPLPVPAVADAAVRLLARHLMQPGLPHDMVRVPPGGLVERNSLMDAGSSDRPLAAALRYIQEHAAEPTLSAACLARQVGMCRRSLERRFRDRLHGTIAHAIRDARVRMTREQLVETDADMERIAERCGFSSATILYRVFRHATGESPHAYRRARRRQAG